MPPQSETSEDRAFHTESVGKLDDVAAAGGLLPTPHDGRGNKAGWSEPASIGGDDSRSDLRQDRSHLIVSMHVVGEALRQDHRPAIDWTVFDIGDPQPIGLYSFHRFASSFGSGDFRAQCCSPATFEMNARRSASIRSGCSNAAKWPPDDISLQWTML